MRVLRTPDGEWRAEQRADGWWLFRNGALILARVSLDQAVAFLLDAGVDPETLVKD